MTTSLRRIAISLLTFATLSHSLSIRSPPGAIAIKRLVQLKEHASDDLHRSDRSWEESANMCESATTLLRQESKQALLNTQTLETNIVGVKQKFNTTQTSVHQKRKDVIQMDQDIEEMTENELKEAGQKLSSATLKLTEAIEVARPENSRLTLAIAKTQRVIDSIKLNTQVVDGEDVQDAPDQGPTEENTDAGAATVPSTTLLDVETIPNAEDVGPRFVAAIVKLRDLKVAIEVLRNNSMEVFDLKVTHAESQMKYAKDKMIKIANEVNATKKNLDVTRTMIGTLEHELVNLTVWEAALKEKLVVEKDNYRRAEAAAEETSRFCKSAHDDYKEVSWVGRLVGGGVFVCVGGWADVLCCVVGDIFLFVLCRLDCGRVVLGQLSMN